jgi:hypothetical protein
MTVYPLVFCMFDIQMILQGFLLGSFLCCFSYYRLFRKCIFGAADEIELKFMDRCIHACGPFYLCAFMHDHLLPMQDINNK